MLSGNFDIKKNGTYNGLTVTYNNKQFHDYTLIVTDIAGDNHPKYPEEGSITVDKNATGIDFESTGVAKIELSTKGVPLDEGADIIIMLDTSSSMSTCLVCKNNQGKPVRHDGSEPYRCPYNNKTRSQALEDALKNLVSYLKTAGPNNTPLNAKVAIADFNGYFANGLNNGGTPYDRNDSTDAVKQDDGNNGSGYRQGSEAKVYTNNTNRLDETAFVSAADLAENYTLNYTSGTNYDYAFDAIYQMGTAIREENVKNGEADRDLFVIFMSDGAGLQWNYFTTQNAYDKWNNWITGAWGEKDLTTANLNSEAHAYYYDLVDHNGDGMRNEHRMANAVKGDPEQDYVVIRKTTEGLPSDVLTKVDGKDNLYTVPGLGAKLFSINFDAQQDGDITEANIDKAIASLASEQTEATKYYYKINTAEGLNEAFSVIGSTFAQAATNARFVDQMGEQYSIQMAPIVDYNGNPIYQNGEALMPSIQVLRYDVYTQADADAVAEGTAGDRVTNAMVGTRKGTFTVVETVTFKTTKDAEGIVTVTGAYSNLIGGGDTNILAAKTDSNYVAGVIYAKTFLYNTNTSAIEISGVQIPTNKTSEAVDNSAEPTPDYGKTTGSSQTLPGESFYWRIGDISYSEMALQYYVYLDESMEGGREAGIYDTNEFADLYYDNYLGNACYKETISPKFDWTQGKVSYAFYLVDSAGNIITDQITGATGTFADRITVTGPTVYEDAFYLNSTETITAANLNLPAGYLLFDDQAKYEICINSDYTGNWAITAGTTNNSTYVTNYVTGNSNTYSNELTSPSTGGNYSDTVVWFAICVAEAQPDVVVIDYGKTIPVNVLVNDPVFAGFSRTIVGLYGYDEAFEVPATVTDQEPSSYMAAYGTFVIDKANNRVNYSPTKLVEAVEKVIYLVEYKPADTTLDTIYLYSTLSVIPATTMLYETNFAENVFIHENTVGAWSIKTDKDEGYTAVNAEDNLQDDGTIGKNQTYGYDSSYKNDAYLSNGSSYFVKGQGYEKDANNKNVPKTYTTFSFKGTGFEVISRTGTQQGLIKVEVFSDADMKTSEKTISVLNKSDANNTFELYQIPVVSINDLAYGTHYVRIAVDAAYTNPSGRPALDALKRGDEFYFDAIRVFDPVKGNTEAEEAYALDNEAHRQLSEIRHNLISLNTFKTQVASVTGKVFIDKIQDDTVSVADYAKIGPNNETYLSEKQSVAFIMSTGIVPTSIDIGAKSVTGDAAKLKVVLRNADNTISIETEVEIKSSTAQNIHVLGDNVDKVKSLFANNADVYVVISNEEDLENKESVLSVTDIKVAYGAEDESVGGTGENPYEVSYTTDLTVLPVVSQVLKTPHKPLTPVNPTQPDNIVDETVEDEVEIPGDTENSGDTDDSNEGNSGNIRVPIRVENKGRRP